MLALAAKRDGDDNKRRKSKGEDEMIKEETEHFRLKKVRDENDLVPPPNPWSNMVQTYGSEGKSKGRWAKASPPRHGLIHAAPRK